MAVDNRLIDRVRKLLALADGRANEHESERALAAANALMMQHGIHMADLKEEHGLDYQIKQWNSGSLSQIDTYSRYLAQATALMFDCQYWTYRDGPPKYRVIAAFAGEETDLAIAVTVWPWLVKKAKDLAKFEYGKGWTPSHNNFCIGFASRVYSRANVMAAAGRVQSDENRYALIVRDKEDAIEKWMDKVGLVLKKARSSGPKGRRDDDALMRGHLAGDQVNLNFRKQVGNSEQKKIER